MNKLTLVSKIFMVNKLTLLNKVDKLSEVCMVTMLTLVNEVYKLSKENCVKNYLNPG